MKPPPPPKLCPFPFGPNPPPFGPLLYPLCMPNSNGLVGSY